MVDVVLFDPALADVSRLLAFVRGRQNTVKLVAVPEEADWMWAKFLEISAVRAKPRALDDDAKWDWVRFIRMVMSGAGAGGT